LTLFLVHNNPYNSGLEFFVARITEKNVVKFGELPHSIGLPNSRLLQYVQLCKVGLEVIINH
jgi:hypothetical protein